MRPLLPRSRRGAAGGGLDRVAVQGAGARCEAEIGKCPPRVLRDRCERVDEDCRDCCVGRTRAWTSPDPETAALRRANERLPVLSRRAWMPSRAIPHAWFAARSFGCPVWTDEPARRAERKQVGCS